MCKLYWKWLHMKSYRSHFILEKWEKNILTVVRRKILVKKIKNWRVLEPLYQFNLLWIFRLPELLEISEAWYVWKIPFYVALNCQFFQFSPQISVAFISISAGYKISRKFVHRWTILARCIPRYGNSDTTINNFVQILIRISYFKFFRFHFFW